MSRIDASEGILVLRKGTGHETRSFVKIEPDRLRQLRAGLMEAELSASRHWRCWIAAVTGAARPVPGLRPAAALSPPIGDYIKIASYSLTAFAHARRPTPDDADPDQRKLAGLVIEELMNERFDSLPPPKTFQERRNAVVVATYLRMVAKGQTPDAAKATARQQSPQFEPPKDLSASQIAAIALARADTAEAKRLFCKQ